MANEISCIHLFIYRLFREKSNGRIYLDYHSIREILRRRFHKIPKQLHYVVLKEMEEMNLIKKIGNTRCIKYQLVGKDADRVINSYLSIC